VSYSDLEQPALFGAQEESSTASPGWAPGTIAFDGREYRYAGFILDIATPGADRFLPKTFVCSPDDAVLVDVLSRAVAYHVKRVCAMLDKVGRDRQRQREVHLYGKRIWHSPYRPESAAQQALDFAFGHDIALVARYMAFIEGFYQTAPAAADAWTLELRQAYSIYRRWHDKQRLKQLLASRGVPASALRAL
jgi:hypothetical protein